MSASARDLNLLILLAELALHVHVPPLSCSACGGAELDGERCAACGVRMSTAPARPPNARGDA